MPVKIRLQRHGRKGYAFYHIVIADSRSPRDGKFIERIGSYNPNTNPATVDLKFDKALYWLNVGAQPTDTVRNILSTEGVLMMKHLQGGVKKGAFDEAEAEKRFAAWKATKEGKLNKTKEQLAAEKAAAEKARLAEEVKINKAKAAELAKQQAAEQAAQEEAVAEESTLAEATVVEEEEVKEVTEETPVEETPAVEEVKEETPAVEEVQEEKPAEEAAE